MQAPLIIAFTVFGLMAGAAIAYVIGASAILTFIAADRQMYMAVLPQRLFSQLDVFAFLAMPLFIFAGDLMNRGGLATALIDFCMSFLGRLKGGLGHVNVMTSVFFAGVSGSAVSDAAALGNSLVPEMRRRGYPLDYAAAITGASSIIGPIIPPSSILIFYGALMETNVTALFAAGILPGLLLAGVQSVGVISGGTISIGANHSRLIAAVGSSTHQIKSNLAAQDVLLTSAEDAVLSQSAVNLDEEAAKLIQYQQAYQAVAQVVAVANSLFDSLLYATRR